MEKSLTIQEEQKNMMASVTPPESIMTKPGRGGMQLSYVKTSYIIEKLNTFSLAWNFEVVEQGIEKEIGEIWIKGRLSLLDDQGKARVIKEQFGSSAIKKQKDGSILSLGDDLKAATSDCLKKCASLLGVAHDVYSGKVKAGGSQSNQQQPSNNNYNKGDKKQFPPVKKVGEKWIIQVGKHKGKEFVNNAEIVGWVDWIITKSDFEKEWKDFFQKWRDQIDPIIEQKN